MYSPLQSWIFLSSLSLIDGLANFYLLSQRSGYSMENVS